MEAVGHTEGRQTRRFTLLQVGQAYLNHLLENKEFQQAGQLCQKILGKLLLRTHIQNNSGD